MRMLVVAIVLVALSACTISYEETRVKSTPSVDPGPVTQATLEDFDVGDCWSWAKTDAAVQPCSEPHQAQVYAVFDVRSQESFPGNDALQSEASDGCYQRFEEFVDQPYETSELDIYMHWPTDETWASGDRTVICSVVHMDGESLTGSMEGVGR